MRTRRRCRPRQSCRVLRHVEPQSPRVGRRSRALVAGQRSSDRVVREGPDRLRDPRLVRADQEVLRVAAAEEEESRRAAPEGQNEVDEKERIVSIENLSLSNPTVRNREIRLTAKFTASTYRQEEKQPSRPGPRPAAPATAAPRRRSTRRPPRARSTPAGAKAKTDDAMDKNQQRNNGASSRRLRLGTDEGRPVMRIALGLALLFAVSACGSDEGGGPPPPPPPGAAGASGRKAAAQRRQGQLAPRMHVEERVYCPSPERRRARRATRTRLRAIQASSAFRLVRVVLRGVSRARQRSSRVQGSRLRRRSDARPVPVVHHRAEGARGRPRRRKRAPANGRISSSRRTTAIST